MSPGCRLVGASLLLLWRSLRPLRLRGQLSQAQLSRSCKLRRESSSRICAIRSRPAAEKHEPRSARIPREGRGVHREALPTAAWVGVEKATEEMTSIPRQSPTCASWRVPGPRPVVLRRLRRQLSGRWTGWAGSGGVRRCRRCRRAGIRMSRATRPTNWIGCCCMSTPRFCCAIGRRRAVRAKHRRDAVESP
jgi:hypothetical protein